MGSIVRATAILGSGSAVSLLASLLANKVYAVLVGPDGLGLLGLLQGLLGLSGIVAGMGLSAGLVRVGSPLIANNNALGIAALRRAAWQIYALFAGIFAVMMVLFHRPIADIFLANNPNWMVFGVVIALLFSLAAGVQIGSLNAYQRVGALARVTALSSVTGAAIGIVAVWIFGADALPIALISSPIAQWLFSRLFVNKMALPAGSPTREQIQQARVELLRFGLPYTASQLVGSAVQIGLPFLVLYELNQTSVGYYKAAVLFSSAYIGFLFNALGQDFYPRLSALKDQPDQFRAALDIQQRFVILLGSPLVTLSFALAPLLASLVFSKDFLPTVEILRWQLLGDLFKFMSWTLGFAVLAGSSSLMYFSVELIGGLLLLGLSWWGVRVYGLEGLGIGFMFTYIAYLGVLVLVLKRERGWQPALGNVGLFLLAVGVVVLVKFAPAPFNFWLALLWTFGCGVLLWKQVVRHRSGSVGNV